ncbi:hypothetical protein G7Y89_g2612 [Cudoniella acicularis]|uniref:RING-type domain-containing protein n=1 Tax=Cudoniella acicularis TaxID=354080 RepID=A0A8H4W6T2_9HELO|nr:hypothetical protein G7Y89_g2612 [Cudoniella acicularis]
MEATATATATAQPPKPGHHQASASEHFPIKHGMLSLDSLPFRLRLLHLITRPLQNHRTETEDLLHTLPSSSPLKTLQPRTNQPDFHARRGSSISSSYPSASSSTVVDFQTQYNLKLAHDGVARLPLLNTAPKPRRVELAWCRHIEQSKAAAPAHIIPLRQRLLLNLSTRPHLETQLNRRNPALRLFAASPVPAKGQCGPHAAPRCHYQQSQPTGNLSLGSHSREGQHYDPVHDTNTWFQSNNSNAQNRPTFPTSQQNLPQWDPTGSYGPIPSWQGFGEAQQGIQGHGPDASGYRSQNGTMGMPNSPWNDVRAYEPMPFGYSAYAGPTTNSNTLADQSNRQNPALASSPPASSFAHPHPSFVPREPQLSIIQQELSRARASRLTNSVNALAESVQRQPGETADEGSGRHSLSTATLIEHRSPAHTHSTRTSTYTTTRMSNWLDPTPPPTHRRRITAPFTSSRRIGIGMDSDDDDDAENDGITRHGEPELYFSPDMDEERAMAAMRGALAASKKVPSREAIAALEVIKVEDLKPADRTCIICYNEFGISNPEGLIENPIRLPKCKHVFGDKCIKKWFEDSDSCPYCRDKLPSELSIRKTVAFETLRAHRERLAVAAAAAQGLRLRHGLFTSRGHPFSEEAGRSASATPQRSQDEYEYAMSRAADSWGHSPPSRASAADFSDFRRRQQGRGRVGGGRATHLGRPTSVGSARFVNPITNHQNASQRAQVLSMASGSQQGLGHPQRRSITPSLPRQVSGGAPGSSTAQTPPQTRLPSNTSSPGEEPSPLVAVGSNENNRDRRTQQLLDLQRQMDEYQSEAPRWLDPFSLPRRNDSPDSTTSNLSPRHMHRPDDSRHSASYQPTYGELNDHEARYRTREELFQLPVTENSQSRWSQ